MKGSDYLAFRHLFFCIGHIDEKAFPPEVELD